MKITDVLLPCIGLFLYCAVIVVCNWRLYTKAGVSGWMSVIPILSSWKWFNIAGFAGWLSLIPIANIVLYPISCFKLYRRFGLGVLLSLIGLLFPVLPKVCIAFNEYIEYDF